MRRPNLRTAKMGSNKREFLVRLPQKRYEGLSKIAFKDATSLSYQVNEAIRERLIRAGLEQEGTT